MSREAISLVDVINDKETQDDLLTLLSDEDESPPVDPKKKSTVQSVEDEPADPQDDESDDPESDDEPDESDEADGEPDESDTDEDEDVFDVTVDGETVQVTFDELLKGYSRTADYTRKTQAAADERRRIAEREAELETDLGASREKRQRYDGQLEVLEALLRDAHPKEPDPALRRSDPAEFAAQEAEFSAHQRRLSAVEQERVRLRQEQAEEQQTRVQKLVRDENAKLLKAIPEWTDAEQRRKGQQELLEYIGQYGYTPDDLRNTVDHRLFVILQKAMKYDRATKRTPKPRKGPKSPTVRPGSGIPRRRGSVKDAARKRLAQTGSIADGARVLEEALGDDF